MTVFNAQGRTGRDQRGAAIQGSITAIAVVTGQRQRMRIPFFNTPAAGHVSGEGEIITLVEDNRAVIRESPTQVCDAFAITQLQSRIFSDQRVPRICDGSSQGQIAAIDLQ